MEKIVNTPITKKDHKYLKGVFDSYTNTYKYADGVKKFEKYFSKHLTVFDEELMCKFGLLYDHYALQMKNQKARRDLERKALKIYHLVLKKYPHSHKALWGIGRVWWHRKNKRAIFYVQQAYKFAQKRGKKGIYTQNVGLVYESLREYKKAEQWLKKGLREDEKNWGVYVNIVNFYRLTNQFKKSRRYAPIGMRLFQKDTTASFKKTPWGKKVRELFANSESPLPLIKKRRS